MLHEEATPELSKSHYVLRRRDGANETGLCSVAVCGVLDAWKSLRPTRGRFWGRWRSVGDRCWGRRLSTTPGECQAERFRNRLGASDLKRSTRRTPARASGSLGETAQTRIQSCSARSNSLPCSARNASNLSASVSLTVALRGSRIR